MKILISPQSTKPTLRLANATDRSAATSAWSRLTSAFKSARVWSLNTMPILPQRKPNTLQSLCSPACDETGVVHLNVIPRRRTGVDHGIGSMRIRGHKASVEMPPVAVDRDRCDRGIQHFGIL